MIVVRPASGLGNRLRVISSFHVLAEIAQRDFAVCWTAGPGWSDEKLEDLFEHDLRIVSEREWDVLCVRALRLHDVVRVEGALADRTWTWAPGSSFEQIYDRAIPVVAYEGYQRADELLPPDQRSVVLGDGFVSDFEADMRTWRPVRRIRKAVDRLASSFGPNTVGVHIRRGDAWTDYGPNSPWRKSTDAAFEAAMDRELEADPATTFFLATDSSETEEKFRARYGDAVLTNTKKRYVESVRAQPKDNQRDAVIDMFALARTRRVLASHYSSFSRLAAVIGDIPCRVAVEDDSIPVGDRLRARWRTGDHAGDGPRDTVATFGVNHVGLGHASRVAAIHEALRRRGRLGSTLFVEHPQRLLEDYGFDQIAIPRFTGVFTEFRDVESRERDLARAIVELALDGLHPVILHDVFVHRALYDAAVHAGWPQALVFRDRAGVEDPAAWARHHAPAVDVVFWLGRDGLVREGDRPALYGVGDVVRRPLGESPLWKPDSAELRVLITAGGGGRADADEFLDATVAAVDAVSRRRSGSVEARVVTGPYFKGDVHVPAGSPARYTITGYVPPTHSLYWGSSVVVSQSGYNTFQETRRFGVPQVFVPSGPFGVDDQAARAAARADEADVAVVGCDPIAIADAIEAVVAATRHDAWPDPLPDDDGATQIAAAVAAMAGVDA